MVRPSTPRLSRLQAAAVGLLLAGVGLLVGNTRVSYVQVSDPFGTLLVAQAVARHGTIRLEPLGVPDLDTRLGYRGFSRDGHTYYVYPVGTALAALPFVAAADALGADLARHETEVRLQHWLTTLAAVALVALLLRLARRLLPFWPALLCTACFWAGTSLSSTGGTALWSHVVLVLATVAALDLIVAAELADRRVAWLPLGLLLFAAYVTRPTAGLFIAVALGWVATRDGRGAVKAGAAAAAGLAMFCAFSWREFGELLPPYYRLGLEGGQFSGEALAGLLASPSRGLLVFSPFLMGVVATRPIATAQWPLGRAWWMAGLGWPLLLVVALSKWPMWWGGGCFGPRLLTDVLPGLFLVVLRCWPVRRPRGLAWTGAAALGITVAFSSFVHVRQGLYNPWTVLWNGQPSVDTEPWTRWNWAHPQFLHDPAGHRARLVAYYARQRPAAVRLPVTPGELVVPDAPHFEALGFDRLRPTGRWTLLQVAELLFVPGGDAGQMRELKLTYGSNGRQSLRLELNATTLYDGVIDTTGSTLVVRIPAAAWQPGVNRLRFVLPDSRRIRRGDAREYGMVVQALRFAPAT